MPTDFRRWLTMISTLCEAASDEFDYDDDDAPVPATKPVPYQFLKYLKKHQARQNRQRWRTTQQNRYRHENDDDYIERTRHVPKSQMGYKPFKIPLIRFGKFRQSSRNFLDAEFRAEMGNVTHEAGVSCFTASIWQDGYLLHEPDRDRAVYNNTDPFGLIFTGFQAALIAYLDHQQPMDIFLLHGHLASFGKNQEMLSLGSDGEFLLDVTRPYTSERLAPEHIYIGEKMNLIQWFEARYPGGIKAMRANLEHENLEI